MSGRAGYSGCAFARRSCAPSCLRSCGGAAGWWASRSLGAPVLRLECLNPSILKTERPPVTCARSNSYCGRRNRPTAPPAPPARAGSFNGHLPAIGSLRMSASREERSFIENHHLRSKYFRTSDQGSEPPLDDGNESSDDFRCTSDSGHRRPSRPCPKGAKSGSPILFDHLVGAEEQRGRHGEAERGGGLEIDRQFDVGGLFDRNVRGRCAVQDFDEQAGMLAEYPSYRRTVAHESTVLGPVRKLENGRQLGFGRTLDNERSVHVELHRRQDIDGLRAGRPCGLDRRHHLLARFHTMDRQLDVARPRILLKRLKLLWRRRVGIGKRRDMAGGRDQLQQDLLPPSGGLRPRKWDPPKISPPMHNPRLAPLTPPLPPSHPTRAPP